MRKNTNLNEKNIIDVIDLVSIILPTYNRKNTLKKAILSIINQTYEHWELIIVDDASTDETEDLVRNFVCKDRRIKYIREEKNRGANYCRNQGVKNSRGNYIAFLDSDNYWERNKLEIQLQDIENTEENVAFTFCRQIVFGAGGKYYVPEKEFSGEELGNILYEHNIIDMNTTLLKRECFEKVGGFDEKIPRLQDWELYFRIINVYGYKSVFNPKCLNYNVIQSDSISNSNQKYVDAILYMISKHLEYFEKVGKAEQHVKGVLFSNDVDKQYIYSKLLENFANKQTVIKNLFCELDLQLSRNTKFYNLLFEWKSKSGEREGQSIFSELFEKKGISTIAIYGLGKWGELFYQDIKGLPVKILYGIDQKKEEFHGLSIKKPCDYLEEVDLIVVTVFQELEEVKTKMHGNYTGRLVSIEELIREA